MSQRDRDLDDEIAAHLRMAIEERVARGESRTSAERAARAEFGNVTHVKEVAREVSRRMWFETLLQDTRYGMRALRRTPGFTAVAVLTLAFAIGANSAVFTVLNNVLFQPLPFHDPGRLYIASYVPREQPFEVPPGLYDRLFLSYRDHARVFESVAGYQRQQMTLSGVGDATRHAVNRVSANFFGLLGVAPSIGRSFARQEETVGQDRVVILSNRLWRQRFNGDPKVLGRSLTLDGVAYVVVGVMPSGFTYPAMSDMWVPLAITLQAGNSFFLPVVGRLRPNATPQQARSELEAIARTLPRDPRGEHFTSTAAIIPLKDTLTRNVETSLYIFAAAVAFVLLIACANVANLLLMRAATRRQEMSVRVALGASRMRITRQLLTESLLLALIGGAAGIAVAFFGTHALLAIAPEGRIPRIDEVQLDAWVLVVTLGVSLGTGVLFGVVPALTGARRQPREAMSEASRTVTAAHGRLRSTLVVAEIAIALVLLTGAGLMIHSFIRMRTVETGYDPAHVLTMAVDLPRAAYPDAARIHGFHNALLQRLRQIPGVDSVGAVSFRPMGGMGIMGDFQVEGRTPQGSGFNVDKPTVSPGYFGALGIRLLSGRDFTLSDDAAAPGVVVVSESVARGLWPNESAVGKRISMQDDPGPRDWLTIIGVVNDIVQDEDMNRHATIYLPYAQTTSLFFIDHMTFVVRAQLGSASAAAAMRAALRDVDATIPAQTLETLDRSMLVAIAEPVFQMRLLTVFALLALVLAAIGTYGVLAYDVTERRREIALRLALGATTGDVLNMVLRRTALLAGIGALLGVAGALVVTRVLASSLYQVRPTDPTTLGVVTITILWVAIVAAVVPARRAMRIQALSALPRD